MSMKDYKVYKHTFPNGKVYIGITRQKIELRWKNGLGYFGQYVYKAINKYGWENVKHEVLFENLTKEEAEQKEIELIAFYKSNQSQFGYNIANGGNCSETVSVETRAKISKATKGKTGHKWTLEERQEHSKRFRNRAFTEDWKKKISESKKGSKNAMFGKSHSEEQKRKIAESVMKNSKKKKVYCHQTDTIYISLSECGRKLGVPNNKISQVCKGKRKSVYKYTFAYV